MQANLASARFVSGKEDQPMAEMGYVLSSEEMTPNEMIWNARRAEEAGFTTAWVSDHYHPWIDAQGQSPFVWSVIGGIAATTERIRLGTGVTCPTIRIHPAIIAQATATSDRKSTRLNSSHANISYAVFCL